MDEIGGRWNEPSSTPVRPAGGRIGGSLMVSPMGNAARPVGGRDSVGEISAEPKPCRECMWRDVVADSGLGYGE